MPLDLQRRIARQYRMPLQVASFFAILILSEQTDANRTFTLFGSVDARTLVYRLRKYLVASDIVIHSHRGVGYWLDLDTRRKLANEYGIELGISTPEVAGEILHRRPNAGL